MRASASKNHQKVSTGLRQAVWGLAAGVLLLAAALPGCRDSNARGQTMNLTSTSFQEGSPIPVKYTCTGAGIAPQLAWSAPPARTASLALIVTDPDAPRRTFVHWVLYDLPAETRALPEGLPALGQLPERRTPGAHRFRRDRLWRPLSSARLAAPLHLHALCAGYKVGFAGGCHACAGGSRYAGTHPGERQAGWLV